MTAAVAAGKARRRVAGGRATWRVTAYVGRRIVAMVAVLLVLSFAVFALLYLAPGKPEQLLLAGQPASPASLAAIRAQYHLDEPFLAQYGRWLAGAVHLDLGQSLKYGTSVSSVLSGRVSVSLELGLLASLIAVVTGVPLAILSAVRPRGVVARIANGVVLAGAALPAFATGLALIWLCSVQLGWLPAFGLGEGSGGRLEHLLLPAVALGLSLAAIVLNLTRTALVRELERDYVAFARARGLSERKVVLGYALRNALIPVVTSAGLVLAAAITGAIVVESTFSLPGLGALLVDGVVSKDLPLVQAVTLLIAATLVGVNLVVDLVYVAVDPRLRAEMGLS